MKGKLEIIWRKRLSYLAVRPYLICRYTVGQRQTTNSLTGRPVCRLRFEKLETLTTKLGYLDDEQSSLFLFVFLVIILVKMPNSDSD